VTGSSLPRSGVTSVDRFPSRAELAITVLPPRPELQRHFAFAVSLKARPPFTIPRPTWLVAGKCFSGPDTAYPHLQHNTTPEHNHEGDVLVRKRVAISLHLARPLPATSAEKKPRKLPGAPPEPGGKPAEPISREPCGPLVASRCVLRPRDVGVRDLPEGRCPSRRTSDTRCRRIRAVSRLEFPATYAHPPRTVNQPPPRRGGWTEQPWVPFTVQR